MSRTTRNILPEWQVGAGRVFPNMTPEWLEKVARGLVEVPRAWGTQKRYAGPRRGVQGAV